MAGRAKFDIVAEDKTRAAWNSALGNAKHATERIHGMLTYAIAGFSAERIIEVGLHAVEAGDQLGKFAIKAGLAGKEASTLAFAARLSDIDITSLSTAVKKMNVALSEARTGGKAQVESFHALGLEAKQLAALKTDERFELIADRVSRLGSVEDKTRALTEIFGKAGADLAPMFEEGAAGIRKAREEAEKIGYAFDDETLHRMTEAEDNIKKLKAAWEALTITITAKAIPAITRFLEAQQHGTPIEKLKSSGYSIFGLLNAGYSAVTGDMGAPPKRRGGVGRPGGDLHDVPVVPGFKPPANLSAERERLRDVMAADARQKELMKEWEQERIEMQKHFDDLHEKAAAAIEDQVDDLNKSLDRVKFSDLIENAKLIGESLKTSIEDAIRTGKFNIRDFLSFIVAEFARQKIGELFQTLAKSFGGGGSGGGGILGTIIGAIAGAYGGAKAGGGDVQAGKIYKINENTPRSEYFAPGMSGAVLKNGGLGGGMVFAPVYNIDARGATTDLVKALPGILKQNSLETEQRVVRRLKRDAYGLNQ